MLAPGVAGGEDVVEEDDEDLEPPLHRLCPTYAQDINSPLRHVRTRIYFTSESHVHSLINVLRYCQLGMSAPASPPRLSIAFHTEVCSLLPPIFIPPKPELRGSRTWKWVPFFDGQSHPLGPHLIIQYSLDWVLDYQIGDGSSQILPYQVNPSLTHVLVGRSALVL